MSHQTSESGVSAEVWRDHRRYERKTCFQGTGNLTDPRALDSPRALHAVAVAAVPPVCRVGGENVVSERFAW